MARVGSQIGEAPSTGSEPGLPPMALRARSDHLLVVVTGRPSRAGHVPLQVAIPQELLRRLRFETFGSINQVLIALTRQAITWLDAEGLTLRADVHEGPVPASLEAARSVPSHLEGRAKQDYELALDDLWPNARLSTLPREGNRLVVQMERQPRADAQLTQISLPKDVLTRLQHDGVGAVSQLVISLARYAVRRLDGEKLSLDVGGELGARTISDDETNVEQLVGGAAGGGGEAPSLTVEALIERLSQLPRDAYVVFAERDKRWWDLKRAEVVRWGADSPYLLTPVSGEIQAESGAVIVLLKGSPSDVWEFDGNDIE
ncbi:hypothetical protein P5Y53_19265 [Dyella jiangningensis]|uniref:hypothetical protein n=1 Tax=Dyella jiangningensis TaxID=1379159 RepID=UPI002410B346|nr:hypothetical protein [Dyella jiangningensis]MDG2539827.1 hypothetical protein [Dyella jiangningensis]